MVCVIQLLLDLSDRGRWDRPHAVHAHEPEGGAIVRPLSSVSVVVRHNTHNKTGVGKGTLIKRLLESKAGGGGKFAFSVSHTTRKPRPGGREGGRGLSERRSSNTDLH